MNTQKRVLGPFTARHGAFWKKSMNNLSGGRNTGDVRWQPEKLMSKDLCNPYRAETQAAPAQTLFKINS
ncbi:MAG TPA: hypothetical protein VFQ43_10385 [Nitrososphaera sp.]|nr:hypothetical protein [Nitrososphaera sp.]